MHVDVVVSLFQIGRNIQLPGVESDDTGLLSVDIYFGNRAAPLVQFDGIPSCQVVYGIVLAIYLWNLQVLSVLITMWFCIHLELKKSAL